MSIFDKVFGSKKPEQKPVAKPVKKTVKASTVDAPVKVDAPVVATHDIPVKGNKTLAAPTSERTSVPKVVESDSGFGYDVEIEVSDAPIREPKGDGKRLKTLPAVVRWCRENNIPADVVGRWVWVREQMPEKVEAELKAVGFRWVEARGEYAHNCGYVSRRGRYNPRQKYGEIPVNEVDADRIKVQVI